MNKIKSYILLIIIFCYFSPLQAEWYAGLVYGRNEGKQILETGSKTPDLQGFAGGSRLTYPRNFRYMGLQARYEKKDWIFGSRFTTTGWYVNPGSARNEDFNLFTVSSVRESGLDIPKNSFRDTPYSISGSRNFADATGRTALSHYDTSFSAQWFWMNDSNKSTNYINQGPYLEAALQYAYFKYYVYDVMQWIRTTSGYSYGPIGIGNSFTNNHLEYPVGIGYAIGWADWNFKSSLQFINGYNTGKDFHKQRNINFRITEAWGNGYNFLLQTEHPFGTQAEWLFSTRIRTHHYYSKGIITISGGIGTEYTLSLLGSRQGVKLSSKETSGEISIMRKF